MRTTYPVPKLRSFRDAAVLTQGQLAALAKVSTRTIMRLEAGDAAETRTVQALAKALKCKPADLME
jgi:DNA-binding XRE family transcriptional regulator